jgi:hypothetical protein
MLAYTISAKTWSQYKVNVIINVVSSEISIDYPPTLVALADILNFTKMKINFSLGVHTTDLATQENKSTRLRYEMNG